MTIKSVAFFMKDGKMLQRIVLTLLLCFMAATVQAEVRDFGEFSVDFQGDWQSMMEPVRQGDVVMVVLASPSAESAVNVTLSPSSGQSAKTIAATAAEGFRAQGMDMKAVSESENKVVFEGTQAGVKARMVMSTAGDTMSMVVLTGDLGAAEKIAKTITFKNSQLVAY